ncbi:MAG: WecB/TagA/CpsF family glycosyltransferase [Ilumatobacteraceae bacterium]|nr:WecB/TagA/CpsF family glycosyltransferase [Ilumatobacteraceae bacterium]
MRPPAVLFGIPIADQTMSETIGTVADFVRDGRRRSTTHQVATVNVDFLVNALGDPQLIEILQNADLCIADGMPVVWSSRLLGMPLRERVAGSDLLPRLISESETTGWRIHVFGSTPEVAKRASGIITRAHPAASVTIDPGPIIQDPTEIDPAVLDSIAATDADILCVALGHPKQERFIAAHRDRLGVPVMIGVGGSLDLFVGERRRAPRWMQRTGLEWLARAAQEPTRLIPRYAKDLGVFTPAMLREWSRSRNGHATLGLRAADDDPVLVIELGGLPPTPQVRHEAFHRVSDGASITVTGEACALDSASFALLVGLLRAAAHRGVPVLWADEDVRNSLAALHVPSARLLDT